MTARARSSRRPSRHRTGPHARQGSLLAVALLLLLGSAVGAWDLHHTDEHCLPSTAAAACTVSHPDAPLHAEATPVAEARPCAACLLRTQTRGLDLPVPTGLEVEPPRVAAKILAASARPPRSTLAEVPARGPPVSALVI